MKHTFKKSLQRGAGSCEQMKSVAHAYVSKRECSLQEAAYARTLALKGFSRSATCKQ